MTDPYFQRTLTTTNLKIGTQAHSLSHEGQRYFGLMDVAVGLN
jgi:hypothetical protein